MSTRAVEQVDEWESEPFTDGYRGMHDLADADFSGVVQSGRAKCCMLNGAVVGVLEGDIEDFEEASGTTYEAPSPALPLLAFMQDRSDEVRAKYYTEDTPLSDVNDTLSDGGFTGYVELSENVLSGDYYVVYHGGRSMSVAWVGNTGQLLTDDEAFERANGEVGIYEVRPVAVEPIEIPTPDDSDPAGGATDASADDDDAGATTAAASGVADADETDGQDDDAAPEPAVDPDDGSEDVDASAGGAAAGAAAAAERDAEPADETTGESSTAETAAAAESSTGDPRDSPEPSADSPDTAERAAASEETTSRSRDTDRDGSRTDRGRDESARSTGERDRADSPADDGTAREDEGRRDAEGPERASAEESDRRSRRSESRRTETAAAEETDAGRGDERSSRTADTGGAGRSRSDASGTAGKAEQRTESADQRTERTERAARSDVAESTETDPRGAERADAGTVPDAEANRQNAGAHDPEPAPTDRSNGGGATERAAGAGQSGDVSAAGRLETYSIPSLDPDRTVSPRDDDPGPAEVPNAVSSEPAGRDRANGNQSAAGPSPGEPASQPPEPEPARGGQSDRRGESAATEADRQETDRSQGSPPEADTGAAAGGTDPRVEELEAELADREAELDRLEAELADADAAEADLRAERDELQAELEAVRDERDDLLAERDDLRAEVEELEGELDRVRSQLEQLEAETGAATDAERRLSPEEALQGTNIFVRYESKGQATLESAHDGSAAAEDVNDNLDLEFHTQFESGNVAVAGQTFDEFLEDTIQYQFVTWIVNDLLYEIRDTGKVAALEELYDAIPKIDRAELAGTISTQYTEDGQERRGQESFDVVLRDRMGNPLLVANLNDSRQATTENMMSSLVTASSHVGESSESLAASFFVTSSFFEPEALETAAESTSGGLLSRDKRQSFVKLTRKQGYHLCLVEAREDKFHLAVPEL